MRTLVALCVIALSSCAVDDDVGLEVSSAEQEFTDWYAAESGAQSAITPAILRAPDGRLHALLMDGQSYVRYDYAPTIGGAWLQAPNPTIVGNYGFTAQGAPTLAQQDDGRMVVIVRYGTSLYRSVQSSPLSRSWGPWEFHVGSAASEPVLFRTADKRLELFYPSTDGTFRHMWQTSKNGPWSSSVAFPGVSCQGMPTVIMDIGGRLQVFFRGGDSQLWRVVQDTAGGLVWRTPENISSGLRIQARPGVSQNLDGRIEIAVRQESTGIYQRWENPVGTWSAWLNVTPPNSAGGESGPSMVRDTLGRLWIFTATTNGLHFRWQLSAGGGSGWSYWTTTQHSPTTSNDRAVVPVAINGDGWPTALHYYKSNYIGNPYPGLPGYTRQIYVGQ